MRRALFLLLLSCHLLPAGAQEEFVEPSRFITRVRFQQFTGGLIVFNARFSNFPDTLNFILDSGSGGISLDSAMVEHFNLKPTPSNRTIRGIGGIKNVSFLHGQSLHVPGLSIDSMSFHVNDYSLLTSIYGERIDGIVGYSVLSRYVVKVNYDSSWIEFWTKGAIRYPRGGFMLHPQINTLPVQSLRVRDNRAVETRFLYDMGAGLNLMFSTDFIRDSGFLKKGRRLFAKEAEGMGGKVDMHMTVIQQVRLGPYRFRNVPVYVFKDTFNVTSYPTLGGLIGSDLLRRFNAIINYDRSEIYLVPNSHFDDPFEYGYCGLELYLINGVIEIGDVAKGSPAEKAGLKEGDVVVAVNRNFSQSLSAYKALLTQTSEPVQVVYRRNGELKEVRFMVKSIL
ncbi:aspartyl protease family protein [Flaviaesturariibacter aridisoli]|uniref:PDZ domain-containing protein n=1 Tax=Flaviaesturariibacter aridisoli TaxID=2545761 RepID=A0A4R4DST9_9BACT|nr:aspartyl protease family protein [Flaviaesturariibacter aridisoli]TCZ65859.1 PDZ domain-containing protein [Flaviaesturariibacter aridisoli]